VRRIEGKGMQVYVDCKEESDDVENLTRSLEFLALAYNEGDENLPVFSSCHS
jgi:hypothetical protein